MNDTFIALEASVRVIKSYQTTLRVSRDLIYADFHAGKFKLDKLNQKLEAVNSKLRMTDDALLKINKATLGMRDETTGQIDEKQTVFDFNK